MTTRAQSCHRWLEPATGRYTRPDPIGILPPERSAENLYLYVHANPLRYFDPLGVDSFTGDASVQDCMYCVFSLGGFGQRNSEEGFWLRCTPTGYKCGMGVSI
jgi:uncharacterized protein RhaS with RHS repeats